MKKKDLDLNKLISDSQRRLYEHKSSDTKPLTELPEKEVIVSNKKKNNSNYYILRIHQDYIRLIQHQDQHKKNMEYSFKNRSFSMNQQICADGAFIQEFNHMISKIKEEVVTGKAFALEET